MRGRLAIALTVLVIGVAACGDTADGDDGGAAASSDVESEAAAGGDEPILIVLRYDFPDGEVLPESRIGDSPFCPGGTTHDEHGGGAGEGLVVSTFDCPNGELTITFSPTQHSLKQSSAWRVLEGSGSFEGLEGEGGMTAEFAERGGAGRARFTGTIHR
jgi:hypothetical protein